MEDENELSDALRAIARSINNLGNADAATPMGGMEALGAVLSESLNGVAAALHDVAQAIRERGE